MDYDTSERYSTCMRTHASVESTTDIILRGADRFPGEVAVSGITHNGHVSIDYLELLRRVRATAKWILSSACCKPGDRVLVSADNSPEWVFVDLALALAGLVSVPIHRTTSNDHLARITAETQPVLALVSAERSTQTKTILDIAGVHIPLHHLSGLHEMDLDSGDGELDVRPRGSEDLAAVVYTSGTTSVPKGVKVLERNIVSNATSFRRAVAFEKTDRFLSVLPLSHVFERVVGLYVPLLAGAHVHYPERTRSIVEQVFDAGTTSLIAVPRVLERLTAWGESSIDGLGTVHTVISGGAPLSAALQRRIEALGVHVLQGYGLTETGPVISVTRRGAATTNAVGTPLDIAEVRLGPDGVLETRGPSVSPGYLDSDRNDAFTDDGWFRTGDVARMDEDGTLRIIGRTKEFIALSTGEKIAPRPIEELLEEVDVINQALVIGEGRKHIVALLTLNSPATLFREGALKHLDRSIKQAVAHLPHIHQVRAYVLFSHPFDESAGELTPTGKLKRDYIVEKYAADIDHAYRNSW